MIGAELSHEQRLQLAHYTALSKAYEGDMGILMPKSAGAVWWKCVVISTTFCVIFSLWILERTFTPNIFLWSAVGIVDLPLGYFLGGFVFKQTFVVDDSLAGNFPPTPPKIF